MIKVKVDADLLNFLKEYSVFQKRYVIKRGKFVYLNRFKVGEYITFQEDLIIEKFTTFTSGNNLFSLGMFSSVSSTLPIGSKVGRYTSIAPGLKKVGTRHPIEAVGMASVFYNLNKENVYSYFQYYELNNEPVKRKPVPTPQPQKAPVEIGNDVWIAGNVTLSGGIKIGHGAIIASNSVVTKDVKPYSIVAGIPATHRKWRFPEEVREALIKSKWWDYELGDMYKEQLDFSNPVDFLKAFYEKKDTIRKIHVEKVPLTEYAIFGKVSHDWLEKNVLIDHQNRMLCIEKNEQAFRLVSISPKGFNDKDILPVVAKKYLENWFLYIEDLGYIEVDNNFLVSFLKEPHEIKSTKVNFIQNSNAKVCVCIKDRYLAPCIDTGYLLQPRMQVWETFLLPLHLREIMR